ncbi:TldD/PmbA family protein [bacterium]|nr:MAG: TldD/PmbA family protein [bacterium]
MKGLLHSIILYLKKKRVDYADIRREKVTTESIQVSDSLIEGFSAGVSEGIGIRVLYKGAWGFAASHALTEKDAFKTADEAILIAKAFSSVNRVKVKFSEAPVCVDRYASPYGTNPFKVPAEEKIKLLLAITEAALKVKKIEVCEAFMEFARSEKEFVSTEGADITQSLLTSGGGYHVIAEDGHDIQRRSYPDAHHGLFASKGYEIFDDMDMVSSVHRVTDEALSLLKAKQCPVKETDIIIDGAQMALQLHESCGHPAELDRALGSEISFAGGSFLKPNFAGSFKYGSKLVNITADPSYPGGAGSYKYDDEGVEGKKVWLVKDGVFVSHLSSRESATAVKAKSNGSMRAESWGFMPLIRMSNISIEPGVPTVSELIADTKDGIFFSTNRSWSIDDLRLNFQFGTEIAWEIKNGRLGRVLKNPLYSGMTPRFWAGCDAVCGPSDWRMWGLNSCAKGEPLQTINVGHGASPARFKKVSVGGSKEV